MDANIKKANHRLLEIVAENLRKNRFEARIFDTASEASKAIVKFIGSKKDVAFGGCMSIREMGLIEKISENNTIYTHSSHMNSDERRKIWLKSLDSDFYIASPQAITLDGKLIFIDGTGNRGAAVIWGPRHILLVAGVNKIVRDQDEGLWRARNIAAIRNNIRLSKKNPCVEKGVCIDCDSDERICNIVIILWKRPRITPITLFLINEELGY
ncbi:MAG: lactate utilization protein [Elusimicrobiales bacterium]